MRDAHPAPAAVQQPQPSAPQGYTRRWAVASVLVVALVLISTLVVREVLIATTPPTIIPPPALPPLDAIAVAHPEAGARLVALDSGNGHLVALAASRELTCPPAGACPPAPSLDAFVVLDGRSGQVLATTPIASDAAAAHLLLVDATRHLAYAIAPQAMTIFSTDSGARVGGFALPAELGSSAGAALDPGDGTLALVSGQEALLLRADSGQEIARAALNADNAPLLLDGPMLDGGRGRLYVLLGGATDATPQLFALDVRNLRLVGQYALPSGARLGPLDATDANLFVFGPDGTTWRLPLDALASLSGGQPPLTPIPALRNTLALGENPTLGHEYVADAGATRALGSSGPFAALPLDARWPPAVPLMVDAQRGLVYLPADHGAIVIVQDGADTPAARRLSPIAAVLLARSALAHVWSDYQDPPFFSASMMPVQPGTRTQDFWVYSPYHGWEGLGTGQTSTQVTANAGGGFRVTFTLTWTQLFVHQHVWGFDVSTDGHVRLSANSGDAVS